MIVGVRHRLVGVGVRVLAGHRRNVRVGVVAIVVAVRVLVREGLVPVLVAMGLGDVEVDADREARRRAAGPPRRRAIAEGICERGADERREREHRAGARGADATLGEQVEPEAQPVAGRAARQQHAARERRWQRLAAEHRDRAGQARAERGLRGDDLERIAIRERSRQRVVDRPGERGDADGERAEQARARPRADVEREHDPAAGHQRDGEEHAAPECLAVDQPCEHDGEHRLEVEDQRARGRAGTREPPRQAGRRDRGTGDRDAEDPRQVSPSERGPARAGHQAHRGGGDRGARVEQRGGHEGLAPGPRDDRRGDAERDRGGDREQHPRGDRRHRGQCTPGGGSAARGRSDGGAEHPADAGRDRHRGGTEDRDAHGGPHDRGATGAGGERAQRDEKEQRGRRDPQDHARTRHDQRRAQREGGTDGEAGGRRERGLHRTRGSRARHAQLVACVCPERVVRHQLLRDLGGEVRRQPAFDVDRRQLLPLGLRLRGELAALAREVGLLGVRLRAHRHVLAGGHRQCAGDEPGDARDQQRGPLRRGRRDADHQARDRDDAVVGAEDGGAQPADVVCAVSLAMLAGHDRRRSVAHGGRSAQPGLAESSTVANLENAHQNQRRAERVRIIGDRPPGAVGRARIRPYAVRDADPVEHGP